MQITYLRMWPTRSIRHCRRNSRKCRRSPDWTKGWRPCGLCCGSGNGLGPVVRPKRKSPVRQIRRRSRNSRRWPFRTGWCPNRPSRWSPGFRCTSGPAWDQRHERCDHRERRALFRQLPGEPSRTTIWSTSSSVTSTSSSSRSSRTLLPERRTRHEARLLFYKRGQTLTNSLFRTF